MRSVCILPRFKPADTGGVARHVLALKKHLPALGWQVLDRQEGDCLVHTHAVERAPVIDVHTSHGVYPMHERMAQWQRDANRAVFDSLKLARRVVAVSQWSADQWRHLIGVQPIIIPNGIDLADWQDVPRGHWRAKLRIPESRPIVLWGKTYISDVLDPTPMLEIAVRRPDVAVVALLRKEHFMLPTPPNLYLVGPQSFEAMQRLLADTDIYLATVCENHAIQVLEAMAVGAPVLAYRWGGTAETVNDGAGVLVEPGDLAGLVAGVETALDRRETLAAAGRARVAESYQWYDLVERLANVYDDADKERRKANGPGAVTCSIVIPVYNKARYIGDALSTAMTQVNAPEYEVIVVDDGSTDNSLEAIRETVKLFAGRVGPSVRVLQQPNQGVAAARNNGIREARGEYVMCLDADDKIDALALSRLSAALDSDPGLGIAYSDFQAFGIRNREAWSNHVVCDEYDFEKLKRGNFMPCCNLFRKRAWERAGGYKDINPSWEDYELWLNMGKLGWPGRRVPGALFWYRKVEKEGRDYQSQGYTWKLRAIVNRYHRDIYPPLVSVVIPCYKHSRYLKDAIDSALAQTFPDLEVVVVDDGNDKGEAAAIAKIIAKYANPDVRLVRLDANSGLAAARNAGIEAARGTWIVPLDADDMIEPMFIEHGLAAVRMNPKEFAYTDSILWWPEGKASKNEMANGTGNGQNGTENKTRAKGRKGKASRTSGTGAAVEEILEAHAYDFTELLRRVTWPCTILYSREAWRGVGGYKPQMSDAGGWEDWEFAISLGEIGICGVRVPKPLFRYRQHSANQMRFGAEANKPALQEAMRRLHAATYRGEFPMGCCGGGRHNTIPQDDTAVRAVGSTQRAVAVGKQSTNGAETAMVRYVGNSVGTQTYFAPSGRQYRFGLSEPLKPVAKEDFDWFVRQRHFQAIPT